MALSPTKCRVCVRSLQNLVASRAQHCSPNQILTHKASLQHHVSQVRGMKRNPFTKSQQEEWRKKNKTILTYIAAAGVGMIGMSYAAVPLYRLYCQASVVPGETALAFYRAKNPTDKPVIGISTYNVVPYEAGQYFNKIQHAPGVPKILVGNRLHLAYKRQVTTEQAQAYAERLGITFFEVSPLCNFNITESFTELARIVLMRHGMERLWRPNKVLSLQDLCCRAIVSCTPVHLVDKLPLPVALKSHLKSFSMANGLNARMMHGRSYSLTANSSNKRNSLKKSKVIRAPQSPSQSCARNSCKIS
ncbi:RB40B protein, partial [Amia calva]|nr:RB40B protein [Amia calva]